MSKTAVVILNYNGRELLRKFLPSVIQFSPLAEVIVADNHSTDQSVAMLETEFPAIKILSAPSNLGFCGGYNFALTQVDAEYYVLLNSDVEVSDGWLSPIIDYLDAHPEATAAQPKILDYKNKKCFEYAGAGGGFIDALGYPFCRGRIFDSIEEDTGQYNDTRKVFWASGACMVVRSEVYHGMGGLDEDFFAHMEEIDLCWRMQRSGHTIVYIGQSTVYHVGGGTLSRSNPRKTYLNFRNGLSLLLKNLNAAQLWWKLPLRFFLDWLAALRFLLGGSIGDSLAVVKAHFHFLGGMPRDGRKRTAGKTQSRELPIYAGSVVINYYLFSRKMFKDLGWKNDPGPISKSRG